MLCRHAECLVPHCQSVHVHFGLEKQYQQCYISTPNNTTSRCTWSLSHPRHLVWTAWAWRPPVLSTLHWTLSPPLLLPFQVTALSLSWILSSSSRLRGWDCLFLSWHWVQEHPHPLQPCQACLGWDWASGERHHWRWWQGNDGPTFSEPGDGKSDSKCSSKSTVFQYEPDNYVLIKLSHSGDYSSRLPLAKMMKMCPHPFNVNDYRRTYTFCSPTCTEVSLLINTTHKSGTYCTNMCMQTIAQFMGFVISHGFP